MAEGDRGHIFFTFNDLQRTVAEAKAALTEGLGKVVAQADEMSAQVIGAQIEALEGYKRAAAAGLAGEGGAAEAPQIERAIDAAKRLNAIKQLGLQIDRDSLASIRAAVVALDEQAAAAREAQRAELTRGVYVRPGLSPAQMLLRGGAAAEPIEPAAQTAARQRLYDEERLAQLQALAPAATTGLVAVQRAGQGGGAYEQLAAQRAEAEERRRIYALQQEELRVDQERLAVQQEITDWMQRGEMVARMYARRGQAVPQGLRQQLMAGPENNEMWGSAEAGQMRYRMALAQSQTFANNATLSNDALRASFIRLGVAENEESDALRRHGALTTEYLAALARGETTISEFGYQLGATIGKFAGWTAAATATYGVIRLVGEFGRGAADASSGAEQLRRTINDLDTNKAVQAINDLSAGTNVSVKEAADAIFQYSRVFHTLDDATTAAHYGLAVLRLDNVSLADSVALSTGILQQWGLTAQNQAPIWNMLAAGQREYNARISQTTTILRGSQAAVRQAGGDLNQLVQLAVLGAQALPGVPGQIATGLSRSATSYARQNLPIIQAQFGIGQGMTATTYNFTKLFEEAIAKAPSLGPEGRQELAQLFFDRRLAARVGAAYFTPEAAQKLWQEQYGRQAITPAGTRGALDEELARQLQTFRDRMRSFSNEVQRAGAAFGASGIVDLFSHLITVSTGVGAAVRNVAEAFDLLPSTAKQVAEALILARVAMLALTRTRVGATLAEATGLSRLPGFGRTQETLVRGELRAGTRTALDTVTADLARTNTRLLSIESEQNITAEKRVAVNTELQALEDRGLEGSRQYTRLLEEGNDLNIRILELERQQNRLEIERNAQLKVQADLKGTYLGLSKSPKAGGFTPAEEGRLYAEIGGGTQGALEQAGAVGAEATAQSRLAAMKARLARQVMEESGAAREATAATAASTGALAGAAIAGASEDVALVEQTAGEARFAGVQVRMAAAATAAGAAARGAAAAAVGMTERLMLLVGAMDPLLLALVALPIAWGEIQKASDAGNEATKRAAEDAKRPITSFTDLQQNTKNLRQDAENQAKGHISKWLAPIEVPLAGFADLYGEVTGHRGLERRLSGDPVGAAQTAGHSRELEGIAALYQHQTRLLGRDADEMVKTAAGRQQLVALVNSMKGRFKGVLEVMGLSPDEVAQIYQSFSKDLQNVVNAARLAHAHTAPTQLDFLAGMSDPGLQAWSKSYSARSNIFGLQGGDLSGAIGTAMVMAARYRRSADPNQLQALSTAISAVSSAVNRQVTGLVNASKAAASPEAAMGDLDKATTGIQTARTQVRNWVTLMGKTYGNVPGVMKAVNEIAKQINDDLDSQLASVLSQRLSDIQTQSELAASQITGFSPEADIARAQTILGGLRKQHVAALKAGDWQKAADLQTQINNSARDLSKQQFDNDQALADANAKIAEAKIAPTSPEAEIQRAKIEVQRAKAKLDADKAAGVGAKQTAEDYAALLDLQNTVNQDIRNNADAIFDADQQTAVSSIMGLGPEADLARARQVAINAHNKLLRDEAEGKGQAVVQQDYNTMLDDQRAANQQAQSNADAIFDANQQVAVARITGTGPAADLARARQVLANAKAKLARDQAEGKGQAVIAQDYAAMLDDERAVNELIRSNAQQAASDAAALIQSRADLQEANTLDPVKAAREQLAADKKILATIKPSDYKTYSEYLTAHNEQQAKIARDRRDVTEQYVSTQESHLQYLLHTQQITDEQYVAGLRRLLANSKLSQADRERILSEIYDATHAEAVNLNVGDIKLPTSYEVKRAVASGMRLGGADAKIPQNTGTVVNQNQVNNVTVTVTVSKDADLAGFATVLDNTLKSNFTGQAQAAGLI